MPVPAAPTISVLVPSLEAAAEQRVELRRCRSGSCALVVRLAVLGGDQPREHLRARRGWMM